MIKYGNNGMLNSIVVTFSYLKIENSRKASPELPSPFLCRCRDILHTRGTGQAGEERLKTRAVVKNVERVIHGDGGILLEVLPAVRLRLRARLDPTLAAFAKDVGPDGTRVPREQLLPVHETEEIALVEQPPARGARAEAEVLARIRAVLVPVRVGREQRELVERCREDAADVVIRCDADGGRGLREAVIQVEPIDLARELLRVLRAQEDALGAARVPLCECLWPVGLKIFDDAGTDGVALVFLRQLEGARYEDGGVWVEALVRRPSASRVRATH